MNFIFQKNKLNFRVHLLVVILAVALGIATGLPQIIGEYRNTSFKGIHTEITDDENYHLARTQEAIDGHPFIASPYLQEYKDRPTAIAWLPEFIPAFAAKLFHISAIQIYAIDNFILPTLLALLTYVALLTLTNRPRWALLGMIILHGGIMFETFHHPISPQLNIIFLLLFFWCIINVIKTDHWRWTICGGVALALMINTYFYYWTYAVVFCGLFLLEELTLKNYRKTKQLLLLFSIGVIGGLPNFYGIIQASQSPEYTETFRRFGALTTHFPSGITIIIVSIFVILLTIIAHKKNLIENQQTVLLLLNGLIAIIITDNQHIITGKDILFSSHYMFPMIFWSTFTLIYICAQIANKLNKKNALILYAILITITSILCLFRIKQTVTNQIATVQNNTDEQRLYGAFLWLNSHSQNESVVFANEKISSIIPIYTKNNVIDTDMVTMSIVSTSELIERLVITHYGEPINISFIQNNEFKIWGAYNAARHAHMNSVNTVRHFFSLPEINNPSVEQNDLTNFFTISEAVKKIPLEELLKKYHAEYIIIDQNSDALWIKQFAKKFSEVYKVDNISIFSIQPSN